VPARATPPAIETRTPPSATIAIANIAAESETLARELRAIDKRLGPSAAFDTVSARLLGITRRVDALAPVTQRLVAGHPSLNSLVDLTTQWQALSGQLTDAQEMLTREATRWEKDLRRLQNLLQLWEATAAEVRGASTPAALLARVANTLTDLRQMQARVASRRDQLLTLQDQVTRELGRVQEAMDAITQERRSAASHALVPSAPPIWRTLHQPQGGRSLVPSFQTVLQDNRRQVEDYLAQRGGDVVRHLLFSLFVFVVLLHGRVRSRQWSLQDPARQRLQPIFDLPLSATIVASLAIVAWAEPNAPRMFHFGLALVALIPLVRIANHLTRPGLHAVIGAFACFFVLDRLRETVVADLQSTQVSLVVAIPALAAIAEAAARQLRLDVVTPGARWLAAVLRRVALPVLAVAFAGAVFGFIQIARDLYYVLFRSASTALPLWEVYWVANALVADSLRSWPLDQLRMVRRYRPLFEVRCQRVLRWVLAGSWAWFTLRLLGMETAAADVLRSILTTPLVYRDLNISLLDALALVTAIWFSFAVSRFVRFALDEDVFPRLQLHLGLPYALSVLVHYLILFVGFLMALALVGIDLTRITILAGAIGVGLGFGLQNVINNFVSGFILLFERPIRVGDRVQLGEINGEMRRIGLRSSTMRTWEGAELIIPNAQFTSNVVTNWTLSDRLRRIDVRVGVAYGTPPHQVLDLLLAVADQHVIVVKDPSPVALFLGFGDSSLDFELRVFTDRVEKWVQIRSELNLGVHDALVAAGITIPFPQRDVHLVDAVPVASEGGTLPVAEESGADDAARTKSATKARSR